MFKSCYNLVGRERVWGNRKAGDVGLDRTEAGQCSEPKLSVSASEDFYQMMPTRFEEIFTGI